MPTLRIVGPDTQSCPYILLKKITSIGSGRDCDLIIADKHVADVHCQILHDGKTFQISALGRERIEVNGRRCKRHELAHRDRVLLGNTELVFSLHADGETSIKQTQSDYQTLFEFSSRLLQRYELDALLNELLDAVIAVARADKGFLVLFEDNTPHVKVARNLRHENIDDAIDQLSDSIIGKVVATRRPVIVSDALNDSEFSNAKSVINLRVVSAMCIPLIDQDSMLGLIYLGNDKVLHLFDNDTLALATVFAAQASLIIKNALLINGLKDDKKTLSNRLQAIQFGRIIGACDAMQQVFRKIEKVATTDISVLITGETGTGKELAANEIHQRSPRAKGPFVSINCGAIPENLLESELFGHVKGAFTGAVSNRRGRFHSADGGSLFLDEIGELPLQMQVKLLRAVQEKSIVRVGDTRPEPVDIRIIAATNRCLEDEVARGTFREDLYYRINVINIDLPPLRGRGEDILVIARYLLQKHTEEYGGSVRGFAPNAVSAMMQFEWPGNIRQLENHIKKAAIMAEKPLLSPDDLGLATQEAPQVVTLAQAKEDFQRRYINEVLEINDGNRTKTARDLGVDPRTIFRHLEKEEELRGTKGS